MIEMEVRIDDVPDRLVGNDLLDRVDAADRLLFGLRRLDRDDVILEFDRERLVALVDRDAPQAVRQLLRLDHERRGRSPVPDVRGYLDGDGAIRLDVGDRHIEHRVAALPLNDVRREFHAAEILVVAEHGFVRRVSQHRAVQPRLDPFDEMLVVERGVEPGFRRGGERDDRAPGVADRLRRRGGVAGHRRLDETLRRQPDLRQPSFERGTLIALGAPLARILAVLVPREGAAGQPDLSQLVDRLIPAAKRRVLPLRAHAIVANARRGEIDVDGVPGHIEPRPRHAAFVLLSQEKVGASPAELNGREVGDAERCAGRLERGLRVVSRLRGLAHDRGDRRSE